MYKNIFIVLLLASTQAAIHCQEPVVEPANPRVNQEFKIKIPTARETSFDWYFKEIRKQISQDGKLLPLNQPWVIVYGEPTYEIDNKKNETKIFTFKALQPGTVVLAFQKKHRYKNGKKVTATKEVKVPIAPKIKATIQKK